MQFKKELDTRHTAAVRFSICAGMNHDQAVRAIESYQQAGEKIAKAANVESRRYAMHRRRDRAIYTYICFVSDVSIEAAEAALGLFIDHLNKFPHWYQAEEE